MKQKGLLRDALILFAITLISAALLACVYTLTKDPIEKAANEAKQKAYETVYPGATFAPLETADDLLATVNGVFAADTAEGIGVSLKRAAVTEILRASDKDGNAVGYVVSASSKSGYGGEITAAVGVTNAGEICGFTVLSHSETAGFGAKCDEPEYQKTFLGDKSVADVDMISGATYTSNALKEICGAALYAVREAESGVNADV